jgi:hypothetical protein
MKLKFGIVKGLHFDIVIGLYAISIHFMEIMQELVQLQLEFLQSDTSEVNRFSNYSCYPLMIPMGFWPEKKDQRDFNFAT